MKRKLSYLFSVMLVMSLISYGVIRFSGNSKASQKEKEQGTSKDSTNELVSDSKEELVIVTSFYPMYIATLNIVDGIDNIRVVNLTENQTGCVHDYQLTTKDMRELVDADIAIINGGELEEFMEDVLADHPEVKVITASEGIEFLEGTTHTHAHEESTVEEHSHEETADADHSHEESTEEDHLHEETSHEEDSSTGAPAHGEEGHHHSAINGHVWMNMDLYQQQITTIAKSLGQYDQEHASVYEDNAEIYKEKIEELKKEFDGITKLTKGIEIVIFHDAFAYLAQQLGMEVVYAVEVDSETALSAGEIGEVIDEVNLHSVPFLFTEAQYSTKIADRVAAETSTKVYVMDSLVTGGEDKDSYLNGMRANLDMLKQALNYDK